MLPVPWRRQVLSSSFNIKRLLYSWKSEAPRCLSLTATTPNIMQLVRAAAERGGDWGSMPTRNLSNCKIPRRQQLILLLSVVVSQARPTSVGRALHLLTVYQWMCWRDIQAFRDSWFYRNSSLFYVN